MDFLQKFVKGHDPLRVPWVDGKGIVFMEGINFQHRLFCNGWNLEILLPIDFCRPYTFYQKPLYDFPILQKSNLGAATAFLP